MLGFTGFVGQVDYLQSVDEADSAFELDSDTVIISRMTHRSHARNSVRTPSSSSTHLMPMQVNSSGIEIMMSGTASETSEASDSAAVRRSWVSNNISLFVASRLGGNSLCVEHGVQMAVSSDLNKSQVICSFDEAANQPIQTLFRVIENGSFQFRHQLVRILLAFI